MPKSRPKLPPMFIIDAAKRIHRGVTALQRKMAPAPAVLLELSSGVWRPHALAVIADLRIADLLADGPRDVADLARETGAHEGALYRVLRALARDGILAQPSPRRFALTALSQPLRSDHPSSVRNAVRLPTASYHQRSWSRLRDAVLDGEPKFQAIHGTDLWSYFTDHPDDAALFHAAMAEMTRMSAPMLAAVYDFGQHRTLVDIGGGRAVLLASLLRIFPHLEGIDYDLAEAVKEAPKTIEEAGVQQRCRILTGSFLDHVPAGHDAYLLKHIVHGLTDDLVDRLFANLRESLPADATLLLIEMLVPEDDRGTHPSFLDLQMLLGSGGRERTVTEYRALLSRRGFRLREVARTPSPVAILVAERA